MRTALFVLAFTLAGALAARDDDASAKALKALQGTWTVTAAEHDGDSLDRIVGGVMHVKDNNFHIKTKSGTELKGDLVLDPAKKPKHFTYFHQEGLLKDKKWEGIYEHDGDTLKIIYAEADSEKERPTEFKTRKDSKLLFLELKREQKK